MNTQRADRIFAVCLIVLGLYIVWGAAGYGYMRDGVPGAGYFPLWVGLALAALSAVNLARSFTAAGSAAGTFDAVGLYKTLAIIAVVVAFILLTPWLGMLAGSGGLVAGAAFAIRPRWTRAFGATVVAMATLFPLVAYFLFAIYLRVPVVRGVFGF